MCQRPWRLSVSILDGALCSNLTLIVLTYEIYNVHEKKAVTVGQTSQQSPNSLSRIVALISRERA